ncbi:MAG: hypothetical protein Q7K03_11705 [Dehalococcoidia bacterium]|nr:hypothetical protein [Dehalococcoidia bacterium]
MFALVKEMNIYDTERQRILETSTPRERLMLLTPMLQREQQRAT